jgi:hypothetical protein
MGDEYWVANSSVWNPLPRRTSAAGRRKHHQYSSIQNSQKKKKMHIPEPKTLFIGPPKRRTSQFSDGSF